MKSAGTRRHLSAWHALMTAHAVLGDALERKLGGPGAAPLPWLEALAILARAPMGACRMQELADHMVLSKSGATRLVDRMEAAGLVARQACLSDRRGTFVVLTDNGRQVYRRTEPTLLASIEEHFGGHLTDEEIERLESTLNKVLEANGYAPHEPGLGRRAGGRRHTRPAAPPGSRAGGGSR